MATFLNIMTLSPSWLGKIPRLSGTLWCPVSIQINSMREGPDAKLLAGCGPQFCQAMRLHDQEEHDQRTEDHVLQVGRRGRGQRQAHPVRSGEHTSELQSPCNLVCRLLLAK